MAEKLSPTQKKILEAIEKGEKLAALLKDRQPFDFPCINDDCTRDEDSNHRAVGMAWKNSKGDFESFCRRCGHDFKMTKYEFKKQKEKIDKEKARLNMNSAAVPTAPSRKFVGYEDYEDYADDFEEVAGF